MSNDELIEKIAKGTEVRARFSSAETMIDNPSKEEYEVAIEDGLADINSFKPITNLTLEQMYNKGSIWIRLIYLATEMNIYRLLIKDWVANGMDANIEDLSLASKLPDYQSLYSDLKIEFEEKAEDVKAGGPVTRGSSFSTAPATMGSVGNNSAYLQALKHQLEKNNTVH